MKRIFTGMLVAALAFAISFSTAASASAGELATADISAKSKKAKAKQKKRSKAKCKAKRGKAKAKQSATKKSSLRGKRQSAAKKKAAAKKRRAAAKKKRANCKKSKNRPNKQRPSKTGKGQPEKPSKERTVGGLPDGTYADSKNDVKVVLSASGSKVDVSFTLKNPFLMTYTVSGPVAMDGTTITASGSQTTAGGSGNLEWDLVLHSSLSYVLRATHTVEFAEGRPAVEKGVFKGRLSAG